MKKEPKSTQIGLRIDNDVLNKIEELAEFDKVDKMTWIRQAIADRIDEIEEEMNDVTIEDFIHARISEEELKKEMKWKQVPQDLLEARAEILKFIITKGKEGR